MPIALIMAAMPFSSRLDIGASKSLPVKWSSFLISTLRSSVLLVAVVRLDKLDHRVVLMQLLHQVQPHTLASLCSSRAL